MTMAVKLLRASEELLWELLPPQELSRTVITNEKMSEEGFIFNSNSLSKNDKHPNPLAIAIDAEHVSHQNVMCFFWILATIQQNMGGAGQMYQMNSTHDRWLKTWALCLRHRATLDQHMLSPLNQESKTVRWQDARFLLPLVLLALVAWTMASSPEYAGSYSMMFLFGVVLFDAFWRSPWGSHPAQADSAYFRGVLRTYAVLHLALLLLALVLACQGTWIVALSLALCMGTLSGTVGHAAAHALGHSPLKFDKYLAWTLTSSMGYPHFMVEHYRGHHPRAATWEDPTSAHERESFWRFLPRSLKGEFASSFELESHRLAQRHLQWLKSPLVWAFIGIALALAALLVLFAWTVLLFCLVHCLIAVFFLAAFNYIEHYGLYRDSLHGFYLPFVKTHAWNANAPISGALLFDRPVHSDHHISPWKPFGMSAPMDAPSLPTGYIGSVLLAMLPFVWFALMDPRLVELQRLADAFESGCSSMKSPL